jgi:hydrogenase-4 component B
MPQTAWLFLIAAIAICGIPPFNGFISEFIIYTGLYQLLQNSSVVSLILIIFSVLILVLIGGLALLCFTKAFGIVFLGTERSKLPEKIKEVPFIQLLPLYLITILIVSIGIFPNSFLKFLSKPIVLLTGNPSIKVFSFPETSSFALQYISWAAWGLVLMILLVFSLRKLATRKRKIETLTTWGCGYVATSPKLQYTSSSFVRTYSKLYGSLLLSIKKEKEIKGIFPSKGQYETYPYDKIEKWLIDKPIKAYKSFLGRFLFLQNGRLQISILYGIIFIISVISLPLIYQKIILFVDFLKQL